MNQDDRRRDERAASPGVGALIVSRHFWARMAALLGSVVLFVVLFNLALMPLWTRHGSGVAVPEVRQLSAEDAEDALESVGLRAELRPQPFNPNLAPDVVVDQNPLPNASVKPGRRVYYYVNERPREMVRVPDISSRSEGVARADLEEVGLFVGQIRTDSVHTPYEGTVTRQTPRGGHQVPRGTRVTLWLSPGLGRNRVVVPDVTGLSPAEARRIIREASLWVDSPNARGVEVRWQEPGAGTRLREGEEVRIHTTPPPNRPEASVPQETARPVERPRSAVAPRTPQRERPTAPTRRTPEPSEPEDRPAPEPDAEPVKPPAEPSTPKPPAGDEGD